MAIPDWITKKLFTKSLQTFLSTQDVNVLEIIGNGIDKYYSDHVFRATIVYTSDQSDKHRQISVVVKRSPQLSMAIKVSEELNFFEKEIEMYQKTLPELHEILGNVETLSPTYLYSQLKPSPLLVIEDLTPAGFKTIHYHAGLDLEHCLLVVKKMALLHSASLVLHEKDPQAYKNYSKSMFCENSLVFNWIQLSVNELITTCNKSPEYQKYGAKLERIKDKLPMKCVAASQANPDGFCVLNHGDVWTNNFLFSYDENGKLEDMKFIDYQIVAYGSPAIDLYYLWCCTPNIEVRRQHLHTVLDYYYNQFESNVKNLKYIGKNFPSKEEFKTDFFSRAYLGLAIAIVLMPGIMCDRSRNDANIDSWSSAEDKGEGSLRHHMFNTPLAWKHFYYLLPFFDQLGVFD